MRGRTTITLFAASLAAVSVCVAADDPLDGLAWLTGTWRGENAGISMEEHWTTPEGGLMLGVHRDVFDNGRVFFEYLRIEARGDDVVYVASPRGTGTTDFKMVELDDRRVVFENPDHDFPQRVEYRLEGETLRAEVSGMAHGEQRRSGWTWTRVTAD